VVFAASRHGRASEIVAWSNAAASVGLGAGAYMLGRSWPIAIGGFVIAFVLLRVALAHRLTVWMAASFGTLAIAGAGGGLSWLFAHLIEEPSAPSIAAITGALVSATGPAWAYAKLAERRAQEVPDSLVDPVSPSSRN
jgi:hypothetical protein